MSIKSAPFYWIECDHPGCTMRCPDERGEVVAWADESQAIFSAEDSGWVRFPDVWLCPDHEAQYCTKCGRHVGALAGEQDYLCGTCAGATS